MKSHELWFDKARNELDNAKELLSDRTPSLDSAIRYAIEAAVKALKAYLKSQGESFDESDLVKLVDLCAEIDPAFSGLTDLAEDLTAYAIIFRDPSEAEITPEKNEAAEAVRLAEEIIEFTAAKIN